MHRERNVRASSDRMPLRLGDRDALNRHADVIYRPRPDRQGPQQIECRDATETRSKRQIRVVFQSSAREIFLSSNHCPQLPAGIFVRKRYRLSQKTPAVQSLLSASNCCSHGRQSAYRRRRPSARDVAVDGIPPRSAKYDRHGAIASWFEPGRGSRRVNSQKRPKASRNLSRTGTKEVEVPA